MTLWKVIANIIVQAGAWKLNLKQPNLRRLEILSEKQPTVLYTL